MALLYHDDAAMSKKADTFKPKSKRNPLALDLPADLRSRLQVIAANNDLTLSALTRMCIHSGVTLVEKKLTELREQAAMPS